MPRLVPISSKKLVKILKELGFDEVRQKGSHLRMSHADGRKTVIPMHAGEKVGVGLLRAILRQVNLSVREFEELR